MRKSFSLSDSGKGSEMSGLTPYENKRLAELTQALIQPPALPAPGDSLVVYGYIRVPRDQLARTLRLEGVVTAFARDHTLQLVTTFTDGAVEHHVPQRPGFAALLDVLRLPGTHGAVIPDWHHLSAEPEELQALVRLIVRTGCRIFVVQDGHVWQSDDVPVHRSAADEDLAEDITGWRVARAERWKYRRLLWRSPDD